MNMAIYSLQLIYRLKMVIFHSYVSLPEGKKLGKPVGLNTQKLC